MKTPFMWAGSKDKNWPEIRAYIPSHFTRYVEPFVGGGSVYFRMLSRNANLTCAIADVNVELLNCYRRLRDSTQFIEDNLPIKKCKSTFLSWVKMEQSQDAISATRFLYLNRNRFFGLGGWMNADRYARNTVVERIRFFGPRMASTTFYDNAFQIELMPTDFVFCDPPYPETNNSSCYNVDDATVLDINLKYLNRVKLAGCSFLFITKNVPQVLSEVKRLNLHYDVKHWTFRRPGKDVQLSEELWITKSEPVDPFDFS